MNISHNNSYFPLTVITRTATECRRSPQASLVPPSGYIGSLVTTESGCGTTETPWRVRAQPGQRINFTLLDFATVNASLTEGGRGASHCHVYVILKESRAGRSVTVCGGQGREKAIFTSTSHDVEVRVLTGASANARYFLLKYDGEWPTFIFILIHFLFHKTSVILETRRS